MSLDASAMANHRFSSDLIEPSKEVTADVVSKVLGTEALEYDVEKTLAMMLSALSDAKAKISAEADAKQSARYARKANELTAKIQQLAQMHTDTAAAQDDAVQRLDAAFALVAELKEEIRTLGLAISRNDRAHRRCRVLKSKNDELRRRRMFPTFFSLVSCIILAALVARILKVVNA